MPFTKSYHPRALTFARGAASKPIEPGYEDHLVAFRVPGKEGCVLSPAQLIPEDRRLLPNEPIDRNESIVVLVPNTMQAMGKGGLEMPSKRAAEEWPKLKRISNATLAPRPMLLHNFGEFVQATSVMHRRTIASFKKCCSDKLDAMRHTARGGLERSPNKTDARFCQKGFRDVAPGAIRENFPWSSLAEETRCVESGARRAINGRIKTKVRVRLLSDDPALWSPKLKSIIVRSYERDVRHAEGDRLELACQGGCNPDSCTENHQHVDGYLQERFSGISRLQRIPLVLNYLKIKVESFRRNVLIPISDQYDFKIEWDRDTWNVHMVGHLWTLKRRSLNAKLARNWYQGDVAIVTRILQRPQDLETVSLDPRHLETRLSFIHVDILDELCKYI